MKVKMYNYFSLGCFCLLLAGCSASDEIHVDTKAPISVSAVPVEQNDIQEFLTFNGVTLYQKKENIRSNVTGYISSMNFKIGDFIKSGELFATLRTKEQDAIREAQQIDNSLKKFNSPIAIHCSTSGIINILNVNGNDYVAEGDILATVAQPKSLVVQVYVPYEYQDFVKVGTNCEIILQNERVIFSKITGILSTIDPLTQSQAFLIALPNENLPENLNVQVRVVYKQEKNALTIPKSALQTNELLTDFWVMRVVHKNLALKQKVIPLLKNDSIVQIQSDGLKINDFVITEGAYQMQDSTFVSMKKSNK